jgi:NTE family protein
MLFPHIEQNMFTWLFGSDELGFFPENLALAGGGVKAVSYVGAWTCMSDRGMTKNIKRICGTSAGSLFAVMFSLGVAGICSSEEIKRRILEIDFREYVSGGRETLLEKIKHAKNEFSNYGWYSGVETELLCKNFLDRYLGNGEITLKDFVSATGVDLTIFSTNLTKKELTTFRANTQYGDVPVKTLCRASASIPFFFEPTYIREEMFVDGGLLNNYGIDTWDTGEVNTKTMGFNFCRSHEEYSKPGTPVGLEQFSLAILDTAMNNINYEQNFQAHRTVYIQSSNITTTEFDITDEQKNELIENGYNSFNAFLMTRQPTILDRVKGQWFGKKAIM